MKGGEDSPAVIVKCAWCGKKLGEKLPYDDKEETHSICDECLKKHFPKISVRK